jgi:formylglycine-generating enzyme required for sulfatase activity
MAGIIAETGDPHDATGAAVEDLLFLALQERGISVLERRSLGWVLAERNLASLSELDPAGFHRYLPHVRFLVKGRLTVTPARAFVLRVALIDVGSGAEETAREAHGVYPGDLSKALPPLADQLVQSVSGTTQPIARRKPPLGFTRLPEVALTFFRGVEYTLGGRPDLGVAWFSEAVREDGEFLVARLWTCRAYERLGFPDLAEASRNELRASPLGARFMAFSEADGRQPTGRLTVSLMPEADLDTNLITKLETILRKVPGLKLFDPSAIPALASEADLDLSGWMDPSSPLLGLGWHMSDAILQVRMAGNDQEVILLLLDTSSGAALWQEKVDLNREDAIKRAVQNATVALKQNLQTPPQYQIPPVSGWAGGATNSTDHAQQQAIYDFADKLRQAAGNPRDAAALIALADRYRYDFRFPRYNSRSNYLHGIEDFEHPEHRAVLLSRAMDCIPNNDSDLLLKLAHCFQPTSTNRHILFSRAIAAIDQSQPDALARYLHVFRSFDNEQRIKAIAEDPTLIARSCAADFECKMALYETGIDFFLVDDYTNAFRLLGPVAESFFSTYGDAMARFNEDQMKRNTDRHNNYLTNRYDQFFEAEAGVYYVAALSAIKVEKDAEARRFLEWVRPLMTAMARFPNGPSRWIMRNWKLDGYAHREWQTKARSLGGIMEKENQRYGIEVNQLDAELRRRAGETVELEPVTNSIGITPPAVDPSVTNRYLWAQVGSPSIQRSYQDHYDVINRHFLACHQQKSLSEAALKAFLGELNWAAVWALRPEDRTPLNDLVADVAPIFAWPQQVHLWAAIGEYSQAQQILDAHYSSEAPNPGASTGLLRAVEMKAQWVLAREGYDAWLQFLDAHTNVFSLDARVNARIEAGSFSEALKLMPSPSNTASAFLQARLMILAGREQEAAESLKTLADSSFGEERQKFLRVLVRLRTLKSFYTPPGIRKHNQQFDGLAPVLPRTGSPIETDVRLGLTPVRQANGTSACAVNGNASLGFNQYGQDIIPSVLDLIRQTMDDDLNYFSKTYLDRVLAIAKRAMQTPAENGSTGDLPVAGPSTNDKPFLRPEHAARIVESFRSDPGLAFAAIQVSPVESTLILRAQMAWTLTDLQPFLSGRYDPWEAIIPGQSLEFYRLFFAYARELNSNQHMILQALDSALGSQPPPDIAEEFKETLDAAIDQISWTGRNYSMACCIAIRHGAAAGIEGLLRIPDSEEWSLSESVLYLRSYIDLPPGETEALQLLKAQAGRWIWNPARRKYELPASAGDTLKTSPTRSPVDLKPPEQSKPWTVDLGDEVTMTMVWIPPGEYEMGSPLSETGRTTHGDWNDVNPTPVKLTNGFWMGKFEVTQEQWERVMGTNPSRFKGAQYPVDQVSWLDCQAFVKKLNQTPDVQRQIIGKTFRLPTEAEWEYACRAGTRTRYYSGEADSDLDRSGWFKENSKRLHPVGLKEPNAWGLYDMHGNVWEWCQDRRSGNMSAEPLEGFLCVHRGGSWMDKATQCRAASRLWRWPSFTFPYLGFRVVLSDTP